MRRALAVLVLAAGISGCGSSAPPEPTAADLARREALERAPKPTPPPPEPPRFDPADRAQLVEIYCRVQKGDNGVWAARGLADARGIPDPSLVAAYQGAIQALAAKPAAWKDFLAEVEACVREAG